MEEMECEEKLPNACQADIETEAATGAASNGDANGGAAETKQHKRRYWSPKEERHFFDIWGRENYRLTRHGKNTLHFAQWSEELKRVHGVDIKAEEIQAKVNQSRAKFRAVKKQLDLNKNAQRWKKYELINKILKNEYRPQDAEPLPKEALQQNRDFPNTGAESDYEAQELDNSKQLNNSTNSQEDENQSVHITAEHSSSNYSMYNNNNGNNDAQAATANYTTELFADALSANKNGGNFERPMALVKQEEFQNEYQAFAYQAAQNHYVQSALAEQQAQQQQQDNLEFHNMQTPQELQDEQMQQQYQTQPMNLQRPETHLQQHIVQQLQQLQQQLQPPAPPPPLQQQQQQQALPTTNEMQLQPQQLHNDVAHASTNAAAAPSPAPRRRYRTSSSAAAAAVERAANVESLEAVYVEECKKKNTILEQHKEISRKQLQVEERKVNLMETYLPKILEMQEQIMAKLLQKS